MQKNSLKISKLFTNIAFSPLLLISNNSELAAKYLPTEYEQLITTADMDDLNKDFIKWFDIKQEKKNFVAENKNNINKESVLISEIIIEGWENHPEGRKFMERMAGYKSI